MVDNFITGSSGFLGKKLLQRLTGETICIPHQVIAGYELQEFSRFFFLSTYGNMADQQDIQKILRANIVDVRKMLNKIIDLRFEPDLFLFVSSSSVNLNVQTSYSRTKKAAELMIQATDIPSCIVRPYSIVGVGEQSQHLIPTLIRSCLDGEAMDFAPDAIHDFVDVDDVTRGLVELADQKATGTFEFGTGIGTTNEEVLALVEMTCGVKAKIRSVKQLRDYDNRSWFCQQPAKNWKTQKTLAQSISEMVKVYAK